MKRTEMINEYIKQSRAKMIDLQSFNEFLKIKWIIGYLDDNNKGKWKSFVTVTNLRNTVVNWCFQLI